jgi:hypothetical protein
MEHKFTVVPVCSMKSYRRYRGVDIPCTVPLVLQYVEVIVQLHCTTTCYLLNRRLDEAWNVSGHYGADKNLCPCRELELGLSCL